MDLLEVVRKEIEQGRLFDPNTTIVVGVSGGSDSLCLLHLLKALRTEFQWAIHVAHLNHCLRGKEADDDMTFVALLAMDWGLPCTIEVVDVKSVARRWRLSLEETARQVRYRFLGGVARQVGAAAVAVGHNADDQSETVLMHFLRGSGLAGLRGMLPAIDLKSLRRLGDNTPQSSTTPPIRLVRPLLSVPRADIEAYCRAYHLSPRFDRSNLDTTFFRNRLRHQLLPSLEAYNPNIQALLRRTASVAAADYEILAAVRDDAWRRTVKEESDTRVAFDLASWRALPLALQRATLRQAVFRLRPQLRDLDFVHIEQAVGIATDSPTGARATLPQGLCLILGYQTLWVTGTDETPEVPDWPLLWHDEPIPVTIPGHTALPENQKNGAPRDLTQSDPGANRAPTWRLEARLWSGDVDIVLANRDRWIAYLDMDRLGADLKLRRRRPGDRFQPLGMGGREVKVADLMINAKIPQRWRRYVPLLIHDQPGGTHKEGIAWVVGWRIDERVKITRDTRRVIRLRWLRCPAIAALDH